MKKLLFIFILINTFCFTALSASIDFQISSIQHTEKGVLVKGTVTGSDLNSGGIPEQDHVSIVVEVPTSSNFKYPEFYEWYSLRDSKYGKGKRLLTEEEVKGVNIKSILLFTAYLRPPTVWSRYGGLGEWEKKAPPKVTVDFSGIIPLEYAGKTVRIHAILKHVIGGPYAAWPGLLYNNKAVEITVPTVNIPTQATPPSNNQTSGGIVSAGVGASIPPTQTTDNNPQGKTPPASNPPTITPPAKPQPPLPPKKKIDPCKKLLNEMNRLGINENNLSDLEHQLHNLNARLNEEKKIIAKLKKERSDIQLAAIGPSSVYKSIGDDLQRMKNLSRIGANPNLVLTELDDKAKMHRLDSIIEMRQEGLQDLRNDILSTRYRIGLIKRYQACREANK